MTQILNRQGIFIAWAIIVACGHFALFLLFAPKLVLTESTASRALPTIKMKFIEKHVEIVKKTKSMEIEKVVEPVKSASGKKMAKVEAKPEVKVTSKPKVKVNLAVKAKITRVVKQQEVLKKTARKLPSRTLSQKNKEMIDRAKLKFKRKIQLELSRNKIFPMMARRFGQQGIVHYDFLINKEGKFIKIFKKKSSGHDLLDQAGLDLIRKVSGFEALPKELASLAISVPISYGLHERK